MCKTERFDTKEYRKPKHVNARPYKRAKYKNEYTKDYV